MAIKDELDDLEEMLRRMDAGEPLPPIDLDAIEKELNPANTKKIFIKALEAAGDPESLKMADYIKKDLCIEVDPISGALCGMPLLKHMWFGEPELANGCEKHLSDIELILNK